MATAGSQGETEASVKKLADDQLASFDEDYVREDMWEVVTRLVEDSFPGGRFTMLDLGGGNGHFADQVLGRYPEARCTLVDNAEVLLALNRPSPRKEIIQGSIENLEELIPGRTFDLVCLHWVLHHLLLDSYAATHTYQQETLVRVQRFVAAGGRLSVFENLYDGWIADRLPGWLIYHLTASPTVGRVTRVLGANTGGIGVCFRSESDWRRVFDAAGLRIEHHERYPDSLEVNALYRALLHVPRPQVGHFWMVPSRTAGSSPSA